MKPTLKMRLLTWLRAHPGFHSSGSLQKLVMQYTKHSPSNATRRLRELHEEGLLEVEYRKNHAYYSARAQPSFKESLERQELWFNSLPAHPQE